MPLRLHTKRDKLLPDFAATNVSGKLLNLCAASGSENSSIQNIIFIITFFVSTKKLTNVVQNLISCYVDDLIPESMVLNALIDQCLRIMIIFLEYFSNI